MVEAGSTPNGLRLIADGDAPSDEAAVARGLEEAKAYIGESIDLQNELAAQVVKKEVEWPVALDYSDEIYQQVKAAATPLLASVVTIADKQERNAAQDEAQEQVVTGLGLAEDDAESVAQAGRAFKSVLKDLMRKRVVEDGVRLDGRGATDIRPLSAEVGVPPWAC
jgi:polyribonucleotide nucleotidyltransferase